jgi:hypothetical protein
MKLRLLVVAFILGVTLPAVALAQNPLVGAWQRISWVAADGTTLQPPSFPSFTIFTADGFWSQMIIPPHRPKIDKPLEQLTKEELIARFGQMEARYGTYKISGNRITAVQVANGDPNREGSITVQLFRLDGDILVFSNPQNKNEAHFRRAKASD